MIRQSISNWIIFSVLAASLTACGDTPTPTSTPVSGIGNAAVELIQQDMYLRLTQQYVDNQRIEAGARMTATQVMLNATATEQIRRENAAATAKSDQATAQAWQVTVEAGKVRDTATAQAAIDNATATAVVQATATQHAVVGLTATVSAGATATSDFKTEQAPIIEAKAKALNIETAKADLELKRAQDRYWLQTYGGYILALFVALAAGFVIWKKSEIGVIADENGKVRIVMINKRALQPELMLNPVIDFSDKKQVSSPSLGTPQDVQRQIVHETKVVDAIKGLPQGYQRQALGMAAGLTTPAPAVNIQVIQPGQVNGQVAQWDADVQARMAEEVEDGD